MFSGDYADELYNQKMENLLKGKHDEEDATFSSLFADSTFNVNRDYMALPEYCGNDGQENEENFHSVMRWNVLDYQKLKNHVIAYSNYKMQNDDLRTKLLNTNFWCCICMNWENNKCHLNNKWQYKTLAKWEKHFKSDHLQDSLDYS